MKYLGGKYRLAGELWGVLNPIWRKATAYVEPFVGSCAVLERAPTTKPRLASDANAALITLYKQLQLGWRPNVELITEELYTHYRANQNPRDPLTAYLGIGCSFGGKWFGGFARTLPSGRSYIKEAASALDRTARLCAGVDFLSCSYERVPYPKGALVYMDPPYAGTTEYKGAPLFDSAEFWDFVRWLSRVCYVTVSEYSAPEDFQVLWAQEHTGGLSGKGDRISGIVAERRECLFVHRDSIIPKDTLF